MRWLIGFVVGMVLVLGGSWIRHGNPMTPLFSARKPAPRPAVAEASRLDSVPGDSLVTFYRMGDSVSIRVRYVPHGKGVLVEIQPVKVRKEAVK